MSGAIVSADGVYRYRLSRDLWPTMGPVEPVLNRVVWIMLNPSTADATKDDPTIRRVVGFSRAFGFAQLEVVNLFGLRATDPRELAKHPDPVGPDNARWVRDSVITADAVIIAWGVPKFGAVHANAMLDRLDDWEIRADCLGVTKDGHPVHPLYQPKTATRQRYGDLAERARFEWAKKSNPLRTWARSTRSARESQHYQREAVMQDVAESAGVPFVGRDFNDD